jgi:hypothetical protein
MEIEMENTCSGEEGIEERGERGVACQMQMYTV